MQIYITQVYSLFCNRAEYKFLRLLPVPCESTEKCCAHFCYVYFLFSDFMHVIQDYWSFRSMQEFLGRVHLLQLDALLPSHSTQLIHLLSVFKEQMQNMLLTSIFDIFELLVNNVKLLKNMSWCIFGVIYLQRSVGNIAKHKQLVVIGFCSTCKFCKRSSLIQKLYLLVNNWFLLLFWMKHAQMLILLW